MVHTRNTNYATPAALDDDAASMASIASIASTIFDGLEDERLDNIREARQYVNDACKAFIRCHDRAKADEDDLALAADADEQRLRCVKAAWRFVAFVRNELPACTDFDVQGRENVAAFIKGYEQKINIRPIIQEDLRDADGYNQKFPSRNDVVAPITGVNAAPLFAAPFNVPDIAAPNSQQRKRNLTDESAGQNPSEKRGRQGSSAAFDDNDPLSLNVAGAAAASNPPTTPPLTGQLLDGGNNGQSTGNLLPPGARSKRAEDWVLSQTRSKSPTSEMRRSELEALRIQTAAIDKGREANERELAKWKETREKLEKDMEDLKRRKAAKKSKEQKEKEKSDARKHHVTLERNTERQRQALAKAANTSMELQQMQEIVSQMATQ